MRKMTNYLEKLGLTSGDRVLVKGRVYTVSEDGYLLDKHGRNIEVTAKILFGMVEYDLEIRGLEERQYNILVLAKELGMKTLLVDEDIYFSKKQKSKVKKDSDTTIEADLRKRGDLYTLIISDKDRDIIKAVLIPKKPYSINFLLKRYKGNNVSKNFK